MRLWDELLSAQFTAVVITSTAHREFKEWLESRRWTRAEDRPFSIAIDCESREICDQIGPSVARYLSEVHTGAPNGWLYFSSALIAEIESADAIGELSETFPELAGEELHQGDGDTSELLSYITRLGGAVLCLPCARDALSGHADLFVVGFHHPEADNAAKADLVLDLNRIDPRTAVRVASDSALEWAAARTPANT